MWNCERGLDPLKTPMAAGCVIQNTLKKFCDGHEQSCSHQIPVNFFSSSQPSEIWPHFRSSSVGGNSIAMPLLLNLEILYRIWDLHFQLARSWRETYPYQEELDRNSIKK